MTAPDNNPGEMPERRPTHGKITGHSNGHQLDGMAERRYCGQTAGPLHKRRCDFRMVTTESRSAAFGRQNRLN